jgi:hypothetical protein
MPDRSTLLERLASAAPGVRRLAVLDLIRIAPADADALRGLLEHLPREVDEKAALAIIRHLAAAGYQEARPVLWTLYEDPGTPAVIAHAAIVAHDRLLELGGAAAGAG